jgi:DNA end-binding protein Ku
VKSTSRHACHGGSFLESLSEHDMAPRAQWKGYLKLSLVSCPVALFSAASTSERISFHLINRATGNRLKQQYIDSGTGDLVEPEDRIRGYEIGKGHYIPLEPDEIKDVQIESTHTIDIDQFVPVSEIDPVYLESRYYLAPDDKVAEEPFSVIREAMMKRDMAGLARVVLYGRERILMLQPRDKGIMGTTLRYAYEVRNSSAYFEEIPSLSLPKEMIELASHIIDMKKGHFDPARFEDRYQDALVELIKAKQAGHPAPAPVEQPRSNVVNLMEALRRSVEQSKVEESEQPKRERRSRATKATAPRKTARRPAATRRKAG